MTFIVLFLTIRYIYRSMQKALLSLTFQSLSWIKSANLLAYSRSFSYLFFPQDFSEKSIKFPRLNCIYYYIYPVLDIPQSNFMATLKEIYCSSRYIHLNNIFSNKYNHFPLNPLLNLCLQHSKKQVTCSQMRIEHTIFFFLFYIVLRLKTSKLTILMNWFRKICMRFELIYSKIIAVKKNIYWKSFH